MLHTHFNRLGYSSDELHDISRYKERHTNTAHDVIFDVIKLNDTWKTISPIIVVQHIFY